MEILRKKFKVTFNGVELTEHVASISIERDTGVGVKKRCTTKTCDVLWNETGTEAFWKRSVPVGGFVTVCGPCKNGLETNGGIVKNFDVVEPEKSGPVTVPPWNTRRALECSGCGKIETATIDWYRYFFNHLESTVFCPACLPRWKEHCDKLLEKGL